MHSALSHVAGAEQVSWFFSFWRFLVYLNEWLLGGFAIGFGSHFPLETSLKCFKDQ